MSGEVAGEESAEPRISIANDGEGRQVGEEGAESECTEGELLRPWVGGTPRGVRVVESFFTVSKVEDCCVKFTRVSDRIV